jgi:hypothetical protein
MNRLVVRSSFGRSCDQIVFEEENVNLFAACAKPG